MGNRLSWGTNHRRILVLEFTPTEGSYGHGYENFGLISGDSVTISLGGVQVINGNVTTRSVGYDSEEPSGGYRRERRPDHLSKSSVVVKPGTYDGYTFEQATKLSSRPMV